MTHATDKQLAFIGRLRDEKQMTDGEVEALDNVRGGGDLMMDHARRIIDWLLKQPDKVGMVITGLDLSNVESARYAVGDVLFRIEAPDAGEWDGWVFVKNGSEYADERFGSQKPGRSYYGKHEDLLAVVVDDPLAAMQHYGHVTDHCGVCGRKLEDALSVERGIGPVCWERIAS